jgi:hypothetical protein
MVVQVSAFAGVCPPWTDQPERVATQSQHSIAERERRTSSAPDVHELIRKPPTLERAGHFTPKSYDATAAVTPVIA